MRFIPAFAASLALAAPLPAQTVAPASKNPAVPAVQVDRSPWLYRGSDLPQDPDWHFGRLPNGLRYAVRRNGVPPGQVSVRVRVDAGSLMERDEERGYAHLIEHLAFRGSEHVPDGEAKRVWQRLGATFGSDSNASTTPTQTVYKLDLPSATPAGLTESMKILAGMMAEPGLTAAALNAERPVVLAEQREMPGPQVRLGDAQRDLFFAGQLMAKRSPIGTPETLNGATPASVAAFHSRWYRPENTVVIVAGDLDWTQLEAAVIANWGEWRVPGPVPAAPDFGRPDPGARTSASIVEPAVPTLVSLATLRPWTYQDDTAAFNMARLVDLLAVRLLNRRLEARARTGGAFLQAGANLDDVSRSANGTFLQIVPLGDDWEAALRDVRVVIADATATAPSAAEVAREVAEFDAALKAAVDTAPAEAGGRLADELVEALDIRETVTTAQAAYDMVKEMQAKRMFTPQSVLASTRKVFRGTASRAFISTTKPVAGIDAKLAAALASDVSGLVAARTAAARLGLDALPTFGAVGTVIARKPATTFGMEQIDFANGSRLLIHPNPGETGRVYVRVRFGQGRLAMPKDRETPAWAGDMALVASGIGKINQEQLEAMTSGRRIGMSFDTEDDAFVLSATTSAADLPDQLKVLAAKLQAPGWDPVPVTRARAAALASYDGYASAPDGVLQRDLDRLVRAGDTRWGMPDRAGISALTPASFRAFWEPMLRQGPIEVMVFGDFEAQKGIDAVAATFGAMAPRPTTPVPSAAGQVAFPPHDATPETRRHGGAETQAAAVIAWPTGGGSAGIAEGRRIEALSAVIQDRLLDRLRSQEGASYSPTVFADWPVGLSSGGRITALGLVSPDATPRFFATMRQIAADLIATPLGEDEMRRVLLPLQQQIIRASTGNGFWMRQLRGAAFDPVRVAATDRLVPDYQNITPADLQALARKYLQPGRDWTMVVLPTPQTEGK